MNDNSPSIWEIRFWVMVILTNVWFAPYFGFPWNLIAGCFFAAVMVIERSYGSLIRSEVIGTIIMWTIIIGIVIVIVHACLVK